MVTMDATGKQCPIPMVMAKQAIQNWKEADGRLQVLVDNEIAVQNLVKMAKQLNQEVTFKQLKDQLFQVDFQIKNRSGNIPPQKTEQVKNMERQEQQENDFIVVISSETMGEGDKQLGKILMKGFIYALTQMESLPKTILFYNGGATLTCASSECLNDICHLEQEGVEILTCGTCLDFYGKKDKLQVGAITNMYEIVEKQSLASKIIRP